MEVINGQVPLASFNLFTPVTSSATPFDETKNPKAWAPPKDFDLAAHGIQIVSDDFRGDFVVFPYSLLEKAGVQSVGAYTVSLADLYSLNIPPSTRPVGAPDLKPGYPVPLDPLRWDPVNYYLFYPAGPFSKSAPMVRDRRADDQLPATFTARHAKILEALGKTVGV
jgi:hypothetical protein